MKINFGFPVGRKTVNRSHTTAAGAGEVGHALAWLEVEAGHGAAQLRLSLVALVLVVRLLQDGDRVLISVCFHVT